MAVQNKMVHRSMSLQVDESASGACDLPIVICTYQLQLPNVSNREILRNKVLSCCFFVKNATRTHLKHYFYWGES